MILNLKILVLCYVAYFVAGAPSEKRTTDDVSEDNSGDYYSDYSADYDVDQAKHGIDVNQQNEILDLHNELRRKEGSANMHKVHWNEKLAQLAQTWSERCVFEHGQPPFNVADVGFANIGQNIYLQMSARLHVKQVVQGWYDEKPDYRYDVIQCLPGKVCGHYTAVTWSDTKEVGCGKTYCSSVGGVTNATIVVCNYGPPGNWVGQIPYNKGSDCSKCSTGKFFCNKGLCDNTCTTEGPDCKCAANCKNNGEKTIDCMCKCKPGFMGIDCSDPCKDLHPLCGSNPGYPALFCNRADPRWAFIKDLCPKMCRKCR